ncbi:MAG: hypothetical protein JWN21_1672 [Sphingomonas bacterium]|jgi:hypothetical protein|uniref:hypothetical protein n=1 Tax=Sphingomonas bacterium TaxID=1895847 RepID=UPI00261CC67F|nr:hypothetical protein [Sphingomonas bacterium]MDB5696129.1 hypothetical protein [Sphingomonas bacterium]
MRTMISTLLAAVALAAPAAAAPRQSPDARLATLLAGREAGKPTGCISPRWTSSSQIIDGTAIVYRDGRTLWVNRPRSGAEALRDDDILVTRQFGSQLCRIDSVELVSRGSTFQRGFVILGDFVPYRLPRRS